MEQSPDKIAEFGVHEKYKIKNISNRIFIIILQVNKYKKHNKMRRRIIKYTISI